MRIERVVIIIILSFTFVHCAFLQTLRKEVEDEPKSRGYSSYGGADPLYRNLPKAPATVLDNRMAQVAGTPVDFSGIRAKTGRVTKDDFIASTLKNENSLWAEEGQSNYFFIRNQHKTLGDLVTVTIDDELRKDMINQVKRLLPEDMWDQDIYVPGLTKEKPKLDTTKSIAGQLADAGNAEVASAVNKVNSIASGNKDKDADDLLYCEVMERYPNGNLKVRGIKKIPFRSQTRNIEVVAIVKESDIDEKDKVGSEKFFEKRVEIYR